MSEPLELELTQGKTWEFSGTALDRDGEEVLWSQYGVRGMARLKFTSTTPAWSWSMTVGAPGAYMGMLGAVASAAITPGKYYSDIELYSLSNTDVVYEVRKLIITVLPEATK